METTRPKHPPQLIEVPLRTRALEAAQRASRDGFNEFARGILDMAKIEVFQRPGFPPRPRTFGKPSP